MSYREEWAALSARFEGIIDAGKIALQVFAKSDSDDAGMFPTLRLELETVVTDLADLVHMHKEAIPPGLISAIGKYSVAWKEIGLSNRPSGRIGTLIGRARLFLTEATYHMTNREELDRRIVERAFAHLQRTIVVDDSYRSRWQEAFEGGEPKCERLGHVHLLWHGVYSFKARANGAETDLITGGPVSDADSLARQANVFALTEWKLVRASEDPAEKAAEARHQSAIYSGGVLLGLALHEYRYVVLVSKSAIVVPGDMRTDAGTTRHVSIVTEPDFPSDDARKSIARTSS